ncbi:MAG: NB-ARC domain-containing protein [Fischerella sp. CENA71]|nr:NB-ARC domain-containing protein [Fischerella sp. CENA71]
MPILIVFDDVTSLDNLREVVPSNNHFRVLVTTRSRDIDRNFIQEISCFGDEQAPVCWRPSPCG